MSICEPNDLMGILDKLEYYRESAGSETQRKFRRFNIRGEAKLEAIDDHGSAATQVLLRDISRAGVGFLVDRFIEPCTQWRLRFMADGALAGSQPIAVRYCRLVQDNLYMVGGQFIIEPHILAVAGVKPEELRQDELGSYTEKDVSALVPPEPVEE